MSIPEWFSAARIRAMRVAVVAPHNRGPHFSINPSGPRRPNDAENLKNMAAGSRSERSKKISRRISTRAAARMASCRGNGLWLVLLRLVNYYIESVSCVTGIVCLW